MVVLGLRGYAAVGQNNHRTVAVIGELDLDQLRCQRVIVPGPGEREPPWRVDLRELATPTVVLAPRRVAHRDADRATDAEVKLGVRRLPVMLGVPPPPQHLHAGPRRENLLGASAERPLDADRRARLLRGLGHVRFSR